MSNSLIEQITADVTALHITHGKCTVELNYHDGRIVFYVVTSSFRRNTNLLDYRRRSITSHE